MFKSLKISFLLLFFCLSFLTSSVFSQIIQCDQPQERKDCNKEKAGPTCAYFTQDCPIEVCGKSAVNGCEACTFPETLYYEERFCPSDVVIHHCSDVDCNSDPFKRTSYDPVCGVKREGQNSIQITYSNVCLLCEGASFFFQDFLLGPCSEIRAYCDDPKSSVNTGPVCASYFSEWFGERIYANASSGSEACADREIEFWTKGECGTLRDYRTNCLPNNRPEPCTEAFNPVCMFYQDEDGNIAHQIFDNGCSPCSAVDVLYYTPGPCIFSCDPPEKYGDFCSAEGGPVCATYEENGQKKTVSLRNGCTACSLFDKPVSSYADGLCPGDYGLKCQNDAGADIVGIFNPVCAYYLPFCGDSSCRKTYPEPIYACADSKTFWYAPGVCPDDPGVSCENYRSRETGGQTTYSHVCGLAFKECFEPVCKDDYQDQYAACETLNVDYFIPGPCKKE